jgi:hypothetical protein
MIRMRNNIRRNCINIIRRKIRIIKIDPYLIIIIIGLRKMRTLQIFRLLKIKIFRFFLNPNPDFCLLAVKKKITEKNIRSYGIYYGDKKGEPEIKNVNEIKENVADKNFSEIGGYYANKIGKYYKNCYSIFGLENKLHQYLRNCKASDNIRRAAKIKIQSTIIVSDKNIPILKFLKKLKFNSRNYFRIFYYATVKISLN